MSYNIAFDHGAQNCVEPYHKTLGCTIWYNIALYHIVQNCVVPYCTTLCCTVSYIIALYHIIEHCIVPYPISYLTIIQHTLLYLQFLTITVSGITATNPIVVIAHLVWTKLGQSWMKWRDQINELDCQHPEPLDFGVWRIGGSSCWVLHFAFYCSAPTPSTSWSSSSLSSSWSSSSSPSLSSSLSCWRHFAFYCIAPSPILSAAAFFSPYDE